MTAMRICMYRVRRNKLYHNNGDGTFTDVTQKAGRSSGLVDGALHGLI